MKGVKDLTAGERLGRKLRFSPFLPHGRGLIFIGYQFRGFCGGHYSKIRMLAKLQFSVFFMKDFGISMNFEPLKT